MNKATIRTVQFASVGVLAIFYGWVAWLAFNPNTSTVYRLYYLDRVLPHWPVGDGLSYAFGAQVEGGHLGSDPSVLYLDVGETIPGGLCYGMEYFCFEGNGPWAVWDEDLVKLADDERVQPSLTLPGDAADGFVVRQKKAYPVYDDDYATNVDPVRRDIEERYPGLCLVGRNGMHKYNNQDHAMMTAMMHLLYVVRSASGQHPMGSPTPVHDLPWVIIRRLRLDRVAIA